MKTCSGQSCMQPLKDITCFTGSNGKVTKLCDVCREQSRIHTSNRRKRLRNNDKCISCGKQKEGSRYVTCYTCKMNVKRRRDEVGAASLEYLKQHPCVMCQENDPIVLEYDHIDNTTKTCNVATIGSIFLFNLEVQKTRILCVICHHINSEQQRHKKEPSSTYSATMQRIQANDNKKWSDNRKIELGCSVCKYTNAEYPCALDWDHMDESRHLKRNTISNMYGFARDVFQKEIALCRILCANCHRRHTFAQLGHRRKLGK